GRRGRGRRWGRRRRWGLGSATSAVVAMPYLIEELEGSSVYSAYTPDVPCPIEPCLVSLANRQWQVRWRGHPRSTRPASQIHFVHLVGGLEESTTLEVSTQRV